MTGFPIGFCFRPVAGILLAAIATFSVRVSFAGSASWLPSPPTNAWNNAANWTAGGPPNGSSDTATFSSSSQTGISLSANTELSSIVFNAGASAYSITVPPTFGLTIRDVGITNASGVNQNFLTATNAAGNAGTIYFFNSATAGTSTIFTNIGSSIQFGAGGTTQFSDTSSAGNATFTNYGTTEFAVSGTAAFSGSSSAANGTFYQSWERSFSRR